MGEQVQQPQEPTLYDGFADQDIQDIIMECAVYKVFAKRQAGYIKYLLTLIPEDKQPQKQAPVLVQPVPNAQGPESE